MATKKGKTDKKSKKGKTDKKSKKAPAKGSKPDASKKSPSPSPPSKSPPKILPSKRYVHDTRAFSEKGSGIMAGGGIVTFRANSVKQAISILRKLKAPMAFWQISKQYAIKRGRGRPTKVMGYSQAYKKNQITETNVKRAINDSAINAANRLGFSFSYEGSKPDIVKPIGTSFNVLVWFNKKSRQTFLRLSGKT